MKISPAKGQKAFSLVEVVLALAITSFCLIVLLGILPVSLTSIKNSSDETAAINAVSTIVADLKSTPAADGASLNYRIALPTAASGAVKQTLYLDSAGMVVAGPSSAGARYEVAITLSAPTPQNTVRGFAQVSWPPQAAVPSAILESYFAIDRS